MSQTVLNPPLTPSQTALHCHHCKDACPDDRLRIEDNYFCCEGCKTVYEILNTHNLCTYYTLDNNAGQSQANRYYSKSYAWLDDTEVADKLIEFRQANTAQVTFSIPQMHCVSCIWLLENLSKLDAGVAHARVNFLKKTVTIQFDDQKTSLRKLAAMLAAIGYEPAINLSDVQGKQKPTISRRLAYQLGVAGFAFGNVMLFSFPEYVGMSRTVDPWFSHVFGYLSILIALPVLLYSARDYFLSAWQGLRQRQLNIDIPLCLALLSLFLRSVWEITTHTGAGYLDSFTGLTFLLLIGKWFQQRTWHELAFERDYKSYFPVAATVKKGDNEDSIPVSRLEPGDIIIIRNNEIIPADGLLLKGTAKVDYSFVTGESEPVEVLSGERIFAGGRQIGECIEITLTRRVAQSHLTQLWNNDAFKTTEKGQVSKLADAAGHWFTLIILAFGGGAVAYWWLWMGDIPTAINAFTAVMIVACPCTVALSIPFTLGNIMRIMGRHGFYLKNTRIVEAFRGITAVVFDKTGTIMNPTSVGNGIDIRLKPNDQMAVRSVVRHSSHPLSRQLYQMMPDVPTMPLDYFEEIPGSGMVAVLEGREIKIGSHAFVVQHAASDPHTTSGVFVSIDDHLVAHFDLQSSLREGADEVFGYFQTMAPQKVFLLSGDRNRDANMLLPFFGTQDTMHFDQSPQDKLDFVKNLQRYSQKVMMIGDGLNDAGALRQSDLGIVISEQTNNFTPACDAILRADMFHQLPQFVWLAKAGVRIVHQSYAVALTYNAIGLGFAVTGTLSPLVAAVLMPLSSISIVLFGVGMGNRAAKKLLR
jgi:P-type Cu+ transporter